MAGGSVGLCSTEGVCSAREGNGWTTTHYQHPLLADSLSSASPKFPGMASQSAEGSSRRCCNLKQTQDSFSHLA